MANLSRTIPNQVAGIGMTLGEHLQRAALAQAWRAAANEAIARGARFLFIPR